MACLMAPKTCDNDKQQLHLKKKKKVASLFLALLNEEKRKYVLCVGKTRPARMKDALKEEQALQDQFGIQQAAQKSKQK